MPRPSRRGCRPEAGDDRLDSRAHSRANLVAGESYKIYFGGMVTPPDFHPTLNIDNVSVAAAVPEPETYAMMLAGLGALGMMSRRRRLGGKA